MTLDDTVEFFNLARGLKLMSQEKKDLVAVMRALWAPRQMRERYDAPDPYRHDTLLDDFGNVSDVCQTR